MVAQEYPPLSENGSGASAPSTALTKRSDVEIWRDHEWQRLWLTIEKLSWKTLSLVPGGEGAGPDFTLGLAVNLSRTGMTHLGEPIQIADGTKIALNQLNEFLVEVRACTAAGSRLIIALPPAVNSPTTPAIVKASDAALLCILLEKMSSSQARQTVKLVGASRFVGSVIVRPDAAVVSK
jgi:hypothetical protein